MSKDINWKQLAKTLKDAHPEMTTTAIAEMVGKSRETVRDYFFRVYEGEVEKKVVKNNTHVYLADAQVKPNIDLSYLHHQGMFLADKQPEVIICAGDFADMPSLSDWDKGKKSAEGRRVKADIDAAIEGMEILLQPIWDLQAKQHKEGEDVYTPRMVLTLGNHCQRLSRFAENNAAFDGFLGIENLRYEEFGWEVIPFLQPIMIDGVAYCHYFTNPYTGKPLSGSAANMLNKIGTSFVQGHKQTLDVATRFLATTGQQQWGIINGAGYPHYEEYKGMHNHHYRGISVLHNVVDGSFDPMFVSLDWLKAKYG